MLYMCFCKQNTAYEMRISVWSSDVCSSDLHAAADLFTHRQQQHDGDKDAGNACGYEHPTPAIMLRDIATGHIGDQGSDPGAHIPQTHRRCAFTGAEIIGEQRHARWRSEEAHV